MASDTMAVGQASRMSALFLNFDLVVRMVLAVCAMDGWKEDVDGVGWST